MTTMLRKSLWDLRWTTFWFAAGAAAYAGAILAYFPYVRDNMATFAEAIKSYPESMVKVFGIADIGSFEGFLGTYVMNVMWPFVAAALAIALGTAAVAKEVETGTVELWLAVPVTRVRLLVGKLTAIALAIVAMVGVTIAVILGAAMFVGESLSAVGVVGMAAGMVAFPLAIAAGSALVSAVSSDRGRAVGIALGITGASYLAGVVAAFSSDWSWLRYFSIFTAFQPMQALKAGSIDFAAIAVLTLIIVLGVAGSLWTFRRRDAIA
jgi:beta-exotoxin I transport system permease protein